MFSLVGFNFQPSELTHTLISELRQYYLISLMAVNGFWTDGIVKLSILADKINYIKMHRSYEIEVHNLMFIVSLFVAFSTKIHFLQIWLIICWIVIILNYYQLSILCSSQFSIAITDVGKLNQLMNLFRWSFLQNNFLLW